MKKIFIFFLLIAVSMASPGSGRRMDPLGEEDGYGNRLGSVELYMEYETPAEPHIRRGLALLHHMTYRGAREEFIRAIEADPGSAMGYWGQAMTYIHPLWSDPPSKEDFALGAVLVEEGLVRARGRERDYLEAVKSYYDAGRGEDERVNLRAFAEGWRTVFEKYPDDTEAAAFYALAYLATADPDDKSYEVQRKAGSIGKGVLKRIDDHPGGHHYVIHAYDYPELAPMGLEPARSYGEIAPAVPHALHMPTHIFTRLGLWDESIEMNRRSADAALDHPAGERISLHYPHAVDYLVYAYLQKGEDEKAREALDELISKEGEFQTHLASYYTFNGAPARLLLERQKWSMAADIRPWFPPNYEEGRYPAMEALTYFAKALGAARSDQPEKAARAIKRLEELEKEAAATSDYWAKQIRVQLLSSRAWLIYNSDNVDGLEIMKEAAELEGTTEKHPVTPGELLPAQELLGDMYLSMGRYEEAKIAYEEALMRSPGRLNSLYGAGRASEGLGYTKTARTYYEMLVEQTGDADEGNERIEYARGYLK